VRLGAEAIGYAGKVVAKLRQGHLSGLRRRTIPGITALVAAVVCLCLLAPTLADAARSTPVVTVHVTIHGHPENNPEIPGKAYFVPDQIKSGTLVIFKLMNVDRIGHDFEINGVISRNMGANGGRAVIRVLFKRPGNYFGSAVDDNHSGIGGPFIVRP